MKALQKIYDKTQFVLEMTDGTDWSTVNNNEELSNGVPFNECMPFTAEQLTNCMKYIWIENDVNARFRVTPVLPVDCGHCGRGEAHVGSKCNKCKTLIEIRDNLHHVPVGTSVIK